MGLPVGGWLPDSERGMTGLEALPRTLRLGFLAGRREVASSLGSLSLWRRRESKLAPDLSPIALRTATLAFRVKGCPGRSASAASKSARACMRQWYGINSNVKHQNLKM